MRPLPWIVTLLLLVGAVSSPAEEYPRVAAYTLDASFDPSHGSMSGVAEVRFRDDSDPSLKISFFLHGELTVDSIHQSGQSLVFDQTKVYYARDYSLIATRAEVELVSQNTGDPITVWYRGYFSPSRARSESDFMRIDSTGVYLRAYYYSPWFPVFAEESSTDYPVSFPEVKLHVPKEMTAVFVGHHVADLIEEDERVSVWTGEGIGLATAQCIAREFTTLHSGEVNVYCWPDTASVAAGRSIVGFVNRAAAEFARRYSRTAESAELHVVQMPPYGDISGGNVSGLVSETWLQFDSENWPRRHLGHELVHPFVRIPIAKDDPLIALVVEGFPTYFHLPVLEEILGRDWYADVLADREAGYLEKKETGLNWRGNPLPIEKPIDQITFDEIGDYKDAFVLSDRAPLFINYLRVRMGVETFDRFARDLFNRDELTDSSFRKLVAACLPGSEADIDLWLSTSDYPEPWHLRNLTATH